MPAIMDDATNMGNRYANRQTAAQLAEQGGRAFGLKCPRCGCCGPHSDRPDEESIEVKIAREKNGNRSVKDSRPNYAGIRRRRICRACGHVFSTQERVSSPPPADDNNQEE